MSELAILGTLQVETAELAGYIKDAAVAKLSPLRDETLVVIAEAEEYTNAGIGKSWTSDQVALASAQMHRVNTQIKKNQEAISEAKDRAHKIHKGMLSAEKEISAGLDETLKGIKSNLSAYQVEQDRIRREEEARLRAEAAERERKIREAEAEALAEAGDTESAVELLDAPVVAAPVISAPAPKVEGVTFREVWSYNIVNPAIIPREYMIIDEKKIGAVVRAMKGQTSIPGIVAVVNKTAAMGR